MECWALSEAKGMDINMNKLDFPNRITVEVTNQCNVSCTFCNRQKISMELGYMAPDLFYKIIDEASQHLPVKLVPFFRGEPLMHPQIIDFIKYAKEKGVGPIQMASNALLLDDEMQDDIIRSGIDYLSFSLDTLDEKIYMDSRLTGNLEISARNVRSLGEKCKKRREKGLSTPILQVSTINLEEYKEGQVQFINYWKDFVDVVRVYEQHDEKGRLVDYELRKKIDIFADRRPCRKVFTDMIIYWDGRLALCNYDWDEKRNLGDISQMSIQEAWNSIDYEEIRRMHLNNAFDQSICKECHHWKIDYMENGYIGTSYTSSGIEKRK